MLSIAVPLHDKNLFSAKGEYPNKELAFKILNLNEVRVEKLTNDFQIRYTFKMSYSGEYFESCVIVTEGLAYDLDTNELFLYLGAHLGKTIDAFAKTNNFPELVDTISTKNLVSAVKTMLNLNKKPYSGFSTKPYEFSLAGAAPKEDSNVFATASDGLPGVNELLNPPCACASEREPLKRVIMHLNDVHKWTREEIADWLDELADKGEINIDFDRWEEDK